MNIAAPKGKHCKEHFLKYYKEDILTQDTIIDGIKWISIHFSYIFQAMILISYRYAPRMVHKRKSPLNVGRKVTNFHAL
jgi:hypothetical protein